MKLFSYLLIITTILIGFSCKTTKKVVEVTTPQISDLYLAYNENKLSFEQLEFTADVQLISNMNLSFSSIFRMQKDEKIWASFKKFGFEAARMMITRDSIFVLNRLQRSYMADDLSRLKDLSGVPLEFDDLQQMLIGGSFWSEGLIEVNDSTLIKIEPIKDVVVEAKHIFDDRKLVRRSEISTEKKGSLKIEYGNYSQVNETSLAFDRKFMARKDGMDVILEFQTLKFDNNSDKSLPFEIPADYSFQSF